MFGMQPWEIALIILVAVLLFGPKKLPDLARGLGESIKEFKKATSEASDAFTSAVDDKPAHTPPPPAPVVTAVPRTVDTPPAPPATTAGAPSVPAPTVQPAPPQSPREG